MECATREAGTACQESFHFVEDSKLGEVSWGCKAEFGETDVHLGGNHRMD